ncbi:hypothetical protein PC129_g5688 [Phytophthora cactorum]|uniref:Uncharacterized protein n=1 Tax=Phytophthora cactorum TaxID=29920 RepID=A0A329RT51_9STRA|nr:hypothetical protein Pcac1_g5710 [Phytophthora cactorum]KAG2796004.1 hypothetical protein PC111_g21910 [Phytophthora cactorum]KAG2796525.1 hypothetical protein PC112_g22166 [Phytophthora cactorum]KAG2833001.1 hypothetical protein PC113_g20651 [Phytophthora cactorum]KAG2890779.1 hypothetical protein PC117_g24401 [Phytophthora cactorum]
MYELARGEVTKGSPLCGICGAAVSTAWNALEDDLDTRIRRKSLVLGRPIEGDELRTVTSRVMKRYGEECDQLMAKLLARGLKCPECRSSLVRMSRVLYRKRVSFDCSSLFSEPSEALPGLDESLLKKEGLFQGVYVVSDREDVPRTTGSGLRETPGVGNDSADDDGLVPAGKRVIGSVNGLEALSGGYIDCTPVNMLIDSGGVATVEHQRVLKRIGRAREALRPYEVNLKSVIGYNTGINGMIDLPLKLGSLEKARTFIVVSHLHVDDPKHGCAEVVPGSD